MQFSRRTWPFKKGYTVFTKLLKKYPLIQYLFNGEVLHYVWHFWNVYSQTLVQELQLSVNGNFDRNIFTLNFVYIIILIIDKHNIM